MQTKPETAPQQSGRSGNRHIALQAIHMNGKLDGLLLDMNISQHYQNETDTPLEMLYTFPLPWGATLLGMTVDIGDKRLVASVIAKNEAHERYEKAITDGDMPVMVEASAKGLYTANLGNIKPAENVRINVQYAQLLHFEQDRVRLSIPTVIAPRYGSAHSQGGLAAHEAVQTNLLVSYPFSLTLDISGSVAQADISSPSHRIAIRNTETGKTVLLEDGAVLDRDFVLNLDGLKGISFATSAPDGDNIMLLASFCPSFRDEQKEPLCLKILVDCSGSMDGERISSAKNALSHLLSMLESEDVISLSQFGSDVRHHTKRMRVSSSENMALTSREISSIWANMGGTEMHRALVSTFRDIAIPDKPGIAPCVLLITDGDVWDVDRIVRESAASGHRIFAIGVGRAPVESLLREMAEKTGGACEFVLPDEDMSAVVSRMVQRLRSSNAKNLQPGWGAQPLWQSRLPSAIYSGETVHVFARFSEAPPQSPEFVCTVDGREHVLSAGPVSESSDSVISRLGAAKEMSLAASASDRIRIALQYQLVSDGTSLFLVHMREEKDRTTQLPDLLQIEQMMAAGWGGYPTEEIAGVMGSRMAPRMVIDAMLSEDAEMDYPVMFSVTGAPAKARKTRTPGEKKTTRSRRAPADDVAYQSEFTAMSISVQDETLHGLLGNILMRFNSASLSDSTSLEGIFLQDEKDRVLLTTLAIELGISDFMQLWAILLEEMIAHFRHDFKPNRHAHRQLRSYLKTVPKTEKNSIKSLITMVLNLHNVLWEDLKIGESAI